MKFRTNSIPEPTQGVSFVGVLDEVVPDQSLKLQTILERFTRHEALPVGQQTRYGSDSDIDPESESEFNIDVEKARYWDLTEKAEFKEEVMKFRSEYEKGEKLKADKEAEAKAEADKKAFDKRVRMAARAYVKNNPGTPGSI